MKKNLSRRITAVQILLLLAVPAFAQHIPCIWTDVERIVAVGDLHGDYEAFVSIITDPELAIVDQDLRWIAGRTHFVQLGDVMDRGPRARDILDLLIRLAKEAAEAGGMVHFLLGNHEEMNLTGIALDYPDYVTPEQFVSFLPDDYRDRKNDEFLASLPKDERDWIESHGFDYSPNSKAGLFWRDLKNRNDRIGDEAKETYLRFIRERYGPWLLQRNIVIRINAVVFVHGGINEKYSRRKLDDINDSYRRELKRMSEQRSNPHRMARSFRPEMVYQPDSPLWMREIAEKEGRSTERMVYRILDNLEARFMVIGHTVIKNAGRSPVVSPESMSRFEGRVWTIDTGISSYYGGAPSAWVYDNGEINIWPPDTAELPARSPFLTGSGDPASPQEIEEFLKSAEVARIKKTEVAGRTDPWTVTLDDGNTQRKAVFKYISRRRPDPLLLPDSYFYELAAYALNTYLGLDIVPPVVAREIDGIPGSLQVFVESAVTEAERRAKKIDPPDPEAFLTAMQNVRVFENLVFNTCEELSDTYVQEGTWNVYRVDFSESFAPEKKLVPRCDILRCSKKLYAKLRGWDEQKVTDLMSPYLNPEEIKALGIRRILILQRIDRLIRERGEKAVLFDRPQP